jgi:hypothetical protein
MNPQPTGRRLILWSLGLLLAACSTVQSDKRALALQAATTAYESAMRWGYFETAYGYLHPDLRAGKDLPAVLKNLRVTGYEVVQPPVVTDKGQAEATQIVNIDYLYEDRQVVKSITDRQVWRYDPRLGTWWLNSGLPRFQ